MTSTLFLEKALGTLEEALKEYSKNPENLIIRDGVIQRFEYCYELCVKTLERILKERSLSENEFEDVTYKTIIRMAAKRGWIESPEDWFDFRTSRNKTSHAYSPEIADDVFNDIEPFLNSAKALLIKLKSIDE